MAEPVDSAPPISRSSESAEAPLSFGERQAKIGKAWADFYSDPTRPLRNTAEIILRNPAVYLRDIDKLKLPSDLRNKWKELSVLADSLVTVAMLEPRELGNGNGIDKLQYMVLTGNVRPDFRRSIGDMMKVSSDLFAESVAIAPGDEKYFTGNVVGAESWLRIANQTH